MSSDDNWVHDRDAYEQGSEIQGDLPSTVRASKDHLATGIEAFNGPLADYLSQVGLPTQGVLAPIHERRTVIEGLARALDVLPYDEREKASYLSKFTVAISVGLFDGALNYLWNETVGALRRLVSKVDLQYFFSVAGQLNSRYARLSTEDDLREVSEHDLLEACRRIGILSDVDFNRLEHVNFMRNHASAAHPNEIEVNGYELLGWLSNCLKYAITAEPNQAVVIIKQLLANIRTETIPSSDFPSIGREIEHLSLSQIDDFVWTIFGMYTDVRLPTQSKQNIEGIATSAWQAASEDRKYEIGARVGIFRKNAEVARKAAAETFLKIVDGLGYRDEDSLAGELLERLRALKAAHFGLNNFYSEWPHARLLSDSLPPSGKIPRASCPMWAKVLSICFVGNGLGYREGTDESAVAYYEKHIGEFTEAEVAEFLHLFSDSEFTSVLDRRVPDRRVRILAQMLKDRTKNIHHQRGLDEIINFPNATLAKIMQSNPYKRILVNAPRHS